MSGYDATKIVGAIFLGGVIALFYVLLAQHGARLPQQPKTTLIPMEGGGVLEIERSK